ncbi:MAG: hypothetical protein ACI4DQ_11135 [Lachnospiraceae bacterium]
MKEKGYIRLGGGMYPFFLVKTYYLFIVENGILYYNQYVKIKTGVS